MKERDREKNKRKKGLRSKVHTPKRSIIIVFFSRFFSPFFPHFYFYIIPFVEDFLYSKRVEAIGVLTHFFLSVDLSRF